jgi:hypothetical protein
MAEAITEFDRLVAVYRNTAEENDRLHRTLDAMTWADPLLAGHRRHVEQNQLGFGDPAFHSLWRMLLQAAAARFGTVRALEIGVYKGQVISLWSLLAREHRLALQVSALSPLQGQPMPRSRMLNKLRHWFSPRFREKVASGNYYPPDDYEGIIRAHFAAHALDFDRVTLHRGYSTDPAVLTRLESERFEIIYVDGDHTYEGARHDFHRFGPKVVPGGWLVADDASCDLPGTAFWKGHASVSRAVRELPALGFTNVLNVGHNRVFQRTR